MISFVGLLLHAHHPVLGPAPVVEVPFELVGRRIHVSAKLNGHSVDAVVDTGASVSVADTAMARSAGAKKGQPFYVSGAGTKTVEGWFAENLHLDMGADFPIPVALPLGGLWAHEGRRIDLILGDDVLSRFRVEIDYAAHRLRFWNPGMDFVPKGASVIPVRLVNHAVILPAKIDIPGLGPRDLTMELDTGCGVGIALTNRFVKLHQLDHIFGRRPILTAPGGLGGQNQIRITRADGLALGGFQLARPVTDLQESEAGAIGRDAKFDALLGTEVLRRFTVTVDYPRRRILLVPNDSLAEPFVENLTGLDLKLSRGDYTVESAWPDSPAKESGILPGDVLLTVDGTRPNDLDAVRRLFRQPGPPLHMVFKRGVENREVDLVRRETIP